MTKPGISEEQFFNRITERLRRLNGQIPREKPVHPFRGAPEFWLSHELNTEQRIQQFMDHFHSTGGHAIRVEDEQAAADWIKQHIQESQASRIIYQNEPELQAMELESKYPDLQWKVWDGTEGVGLLKDASEADIGIVMADYGASHTGTVVCMSGRYKGRSVSLLPTQLIVVLPASRLKTRLGEVMQKLNALNGKLPAGIHFISGPSRSADIENDLTIGVHGPGIVYVLLVG